MTPRAGPTKDQINPLSVVNQQLSKSVKQKFPFSESCDNYILT